VSVRAARGYIRVVARCRAGLPCRRTVKVAAAAVVVVLAVFAARADSSAAHANAWVTALDVGVGLAFIAGASPTPGPFAERTLVALVGGAWLAGSLWSVARPWHEAALGLVTRIGLASVFAAVAVSAGVRWPNGSGRFPTLAGAALAVVLGLEWLVARRGTLDPATYDQGHEGGRTGPWRQ
jgi:hypothetical protein